MWKTFQLGSQTNHESTFFVKHFWRTHAHLHPQRLQEAGKLRPTQNNFRIPQCDAAPTLESHTQWTHSLSFDQNQSSLDQFSSLNCSWLMYQFKHKNTYTINQIKSTPAASIFHGQWICGRGISLSVRHRGHLFSTHTLLSQTPVTCHFRLLKLLQPPSWLDKIEADIPTNKAMKGSLLGSPMAHTHFQPLWSWVRWSEHGRFLTQDSCKCQHCF